MFIYHTQKMDQYYNEVISIYRETGYGRKRIAKIQLFHLEYACRYSGIKTQKVAEYLSQNLRIILRICLIIINSQTPRQGRCSGTGTKMVW